MESIPVFQANVTLEELAARARPIPSEISKKVTEMRDWDPQVLSGCWVDKNSKLLAVYFSRGDHPKHGQKATPGKHPRGEEDTEVGSTLQISYTLKLIYQNRAPLTRTPSP